LKCYSYPLKVMHENFYNRNRMKAKHLGFNIVSFEAD